VSNKSAPIFPPFFLTSAFVSVILFVIGEFLLAVFGSFTERTYLIHLIIGAVAVVAGYLLVRVFSRGSSERFLRALGACPMTEEEHSSVYNSIDGLCLSLGMTPPAVHVVDGMTGNAAVVGSPHPVLIFTRGAIDSLDPVELEGLTAHLLIRCRDPKLLQRTIGSVSRFLPEVRRLERRWAHHEDVLDFDRLATAVTRYPPGLQRALKTLSSLGTSVSSTSVFNAYVWVLQPGGSPEVATELHPSLGFRLAALEEA